MAKPFISLVILVLFTTVIAKAQPKLRQVEQIRQKVLQYLGGEKLLRKIKTLSYTEYLTSYTNDTIYHTSKRVIIDFQEKAVEHHFFFDNGDSAVNYYRNGKAWQVKNGQRKILKWDEPKRLIFTLKNNFFTLLINPQYTWHIVGQMVYKDQPITIVRLGESREATDLFVNAEGKVMATSRLHGRKNYSFYDNKLSYLTLTRGVKFPNTHDFYYRGKLLSQRKLKDLQVTFKAD